MVYLANASTSQSIPEGKSRQEVKLELWRTCVSSGFLSCLSYIAQGYLPRSGTTHSQLGSPISIIKKITLQTYVKANPMKAFFFFN